MAISPQKPRFPVANLAAEIPTSDDDFDIATVDAGKTASDFLRAFEAALQVNHSTQLDALLHPDCWIKDDLSLTGDVRTISGSADVKEALSILGPRAQPSNFVVDRTKTQIVPWSPNQRWLEAPFTFHTTVPAGTSFGTVRLVRIGGIWKLWVLFTALCSLDNHPEIRLLPGATDGTADQRTTNGIAELGQTTPHGIPDKRQVDVCIVGGGQAGLFMAARLTALGISSFLFEKHGRIGDNWRTRYDRVKLHTIKQFGKPCFHFGLVGG
jgi:hypothetical protein